MENFPAAIGARNRLYLTAHNYNLGQHADDDCLGGSTAAGWLPAEITAAALVQTPSAGCGVLRTEYLFCSAALEGREAESRTWLGTVWVGLGHPPAFDSSPLIGAYPTLVCIRTPSQLESALSPYMQVF